MAYDAKRNHLARLYTQGILTAEEFVEMQRQNDLEEAAKLNARVAEIMGADYLTEAEPKPAPAPKQPTEQPEGRPSLVGLTKEQFNALTLDEQNKLHSIAPDYIEKLMNGRPAYMDIIDPQVKKDYSKLTVEEFKEMPVHEQQELFDADIDTYKKLLEEARKTDPAW